MKPKTLRHAHPRRGFALVVTLTLMILLTVIAVGLLTISSIALRSTSRSSSMAEARQNARLALVMAIGELQKYAGQDQRATATANIAGTADGIALDAGVAPLNDLSVNKVSKRLSPVQPGTRYWTGVFINQDDPKLIYSKTPTPLNIHWLVSGIDSTYNATTPTGGPAILPSDATYAVGSDGNVSDSSKAVVLAGENSVGNDTGNTERFVVAPLVNILDENGSKPAGRYAWWVGDEGVKARINMDRTVDAPDLYASLSAQRRGWETVSGFTSYPTPAAGPHASLPKITDLAQSVLLIPSAGGAIGGSSPLQTVFHSATADSRAVLSDPLNGGTKIDLTAVLSGELPTQSPDPTITNYPLRSGNIIPRIAVRSMRAPRWDTVKDYHDRYNQIESGALLVKTADSDYTTAIAPTIIDFRLLMGARMISKGASGNTFQVNPCGKFSIAIANPYSVPMKWEKDLEIEVINQTPYGNSPSRIWPLGGWNAPAFIPNSPSEPAVFNQLVFHIKPASLDAGEARAYTIAGSLKRSSRSGATRADMDLVQFSKSSPFSFNNCIELEDSRSWPASNTSPLTMDVRESWQTTLAKIEMRLGGTSPRSRPLRRLERFELDNGYFSPNQRRFTPAEAGRLTAPFPLMLYSFQISQPGVDYKQVMPTSYELGQRGSTLRTFADFNLQAASVRKPIASYNPPPYFMESNDSWSQLPSSPPGGDTGNGFTRNLALSPLPWGHSPSGSKNTILFSVPSQLSSLAQLQHADLTGDDIAGSIGHQPGNAMGNSYAPPFVERKFASQARTDYELKGTPDHVNPGYNTTRSTYYDISYLLNASLWDNYFFSTIPTSGLPRPESPSLVMLDSTTAGDQLEDPVKVASHLMVEGAFNVNSTDKNAWKAFLASAKHFKHASDASPNADAAFPRSLEQSNTSTTPPTGRDTDSFSGFRRLTDSQLDTLAEEIVKQVRIRGPFVSLSHFVNRALADITAEPALTRSGALQLALDESGANIDYSGRKIAFTRVNANTDAVTLRWKNGAPRADLDGGDLVERPSDVDSKHPDWAKSSTDNNFGAVASILADQEMLTNSRTMREQGYRSTGIPGWLTQADVLQVIGSSLTSRSDTFRIRTYGEALDESGKPVAKAYCEAIVQRIPAYIDPADDPSARGTTLSPLNQTYGRQYQIVSFRWLSPLEI